MKQDKSSFKWRHPEPAVKYFYRAVDKEGRTIEFMLSAGRDVPAAKRFFKKTVSADHRLNDVIEQDHRSIKKKVRASRGGRVF